MAAEVFALQWLGMHQQNLAARDRRNRRLYPHLRSAPATCYWNTALTGTEAECEAKLAEWREQDEDWAPSTRSYRIVPQADAKKP